MAFPYLLQVISTDEEPPKVYEVVVVTAETEWTRHYANGVKQRSFDVSKEYRDAFSTPTKAKDNLQTGMSPYRVSFKEDVSQSDIDEALKQLKQTNQKK